MRASLSIAHPSTVSGRSTTITPLFKRTAAARIVSCGVLDAHIANVPPSSPFASLEIAPEVLAGADYPGLSVHTSLRYDFLVVGSGIAGLSFALKVAQHGSVAVITKEGISEGCTVYAQGGVCAVLDPLDSVEKHAKDTIVAGNFLNDETAVDAVCREGADRVLELVQMGAAFTRDREGQLHLTKEGGHTARRIVHAADATGAEIARTLVTAAQEHPNIDLFERHVCLDFVVKEVNGGQQCVGVDALDVDSNEVQRFVALSTMLASGGAGELYPSTTNPAVSTGDGIAMAWRAGVPVANMEFIQFHPTSLYDPGHDGRAFLITEAVRGEGGVLRNLGGERFMPRYDRRVELAPRDVVARAIDDQVRSRGDTHVLLDISHKRAADILAHFPTIAAKCAEIGIDITRDAIPVIPAQHYLCGGVHTGLHGETSLAGLYACGEVTYTGLHGANRLASNSLLEGLVFSARAVQPALAHAEHALTDAVLELHDAALRRPPFVTARRQASTEAWIEATRRKVQAVMRRSAGIERDEAGLQDALNALSVVAMEVEALCAPGAVSRPLVELRNLVTCGILVVEGGLRRRESRGLHYRTDYPDVEPRCSKPTVLRKADLDMRASPTSYHALNLEERVWQMCS